MDRYKDHAFCADEKKSGTALGPKSRERVKAITFWFTK